MRKLISAIFLLLILTACNNPKDIVFGPDPLKQIAEQGDQFKKLPEEDRELLVKFLALHQLGSALGADVKPVTGRTVGEVLVDVKAWQDGLKVSMEAEKKRQAEEVALKQKMLEARKLLVEKISASAVVAVINKTVLPKNYEVERYSDLLSITFAVENKSNKEIVQLKGRVIFKDQTDALVGDLFIDFNEPIQAGKTLTTTTGSGWKINSFSNGDIEKIADRDFSTMKTYFEPEAIAFRDGEVLKLPENK